MNMTPVVSSAIQEIGYDETTQTMKVKFVEGDTTYIFCNVPKHVFSSFLNASSKGIFYHERIKGRYPCEDFVSLK